MDDKLLQHITLIVKNAHQLLSDDAGVLNPDQKNFARTILANAEKLIHTYAEFDRATPEQILASMRHELGTPLTPIRGYSDLLARPVTGELNEVQMQCVSKIRQSTTAVYEEVQRRVAQAYASQE